MQPTVHHISFARTIELPLHEAVRRLTLHRCGYVGHWRWKPVEMEMRERLLCGEFMIGDRLTVYWIPRVAVVTQEVE